MYFISNITIYTVELTTNFTQRAIRIYTHFGYVSVVTTYYHYVLKEYSLSHDLYHNLVDVSAGTTLYLLRYW